MRSIVFFALLSAITFQACVLPSAPNPPSVPPISVSPSKPVAPTPVFGADALGLTLADGWSDPKYLPTPFASGDWLDSTFITPLGNLFFGCTKWNFYQLLGYSQILVTGSCFLNHIGTGFDTYQATISGGAWNVQWQLFNDLSPAQDLSEAAITLNRKEDTLLFVRFLAAPTHADIYEVKKQSDGTWGNPIVLPSPINNNCIQDNPHLSEDGNRLWWDSNTDPNNLAGPCLADSQRTIFKSDKNSDGSWTIPTAVKGAPNAVGIGLRWQAWASSGDSDPNNHTFVWSTSCPDGTACTYQATLQPDGSYGNHVVLIQPTPFGAGADGKVVMTGEWSRTSVPDSLGYLYSYFVCMEAKGHNLAKPLGVEDLEPHICVARKKI